MPPSLTILLASVLKPLDDTRMLGKFGRTLASRTGTQVHVAGRLAPSPPAFLTICIPTPYLRVLA
ncbi:hypothetical protein MUN84_22250 [Hymenobacter sp. 5516J-16]|uniref:hypothetical protein n=1 Tax=Hymenobacter sp. 5516J-16 TaxID=2932253 RepID=UPI001FD11A7E|nr:hypothetical protein [Hymenobacter sp. 5516J-16]UOQ77135.1 hypothetical protein MUN84_22250 [Hymenobacter sp. 5516J-16]